MSEVRGSSRECQAATAQEWLRGATRHLRSGAAARRSQPTPKARAKAGKSHPTSRGSGCAGAGGPRGAIPCWRSGRAAVKEIPLIQGKEQWLRFAGAAVKRYPTPKVRETLVRWTRMGEFNLDNNYIYYCGQGSLRRNGVSLIINRRVWNAVFGCSVNKDRMMFVRFQGKPFAITVQYLVFWGTPILFSPVAAPA